MKYYNTTDCYIYVAAVDDVIGKFENGEFETSDPNLITLLGDRFKTSGEIEAIDVEVKKVKAPKKAKKEEPEYTYDGLSELSFKALKVIGADLDIEFQFGMSKSFLIEEVLKLQK
jgi:Zn/Cd-binding protein ZinT